MLLRPSHRQSLLLKPISSALLTYEQALIITSYHAATLERLDLEHGTLVGHTEGHYRTSEYGIADR